MLVVVPTAGIGSRLFQRTKLINKTMLLLGNKPVISHILEAYPKNTKFLIGLGHKGDQIQEFIKLVYPKKKISFVNIKNYKGPGSSLTHTLKILSKKIKSEFIFHANDSVVSFPKRIYTKYDNIFISKKKIKINNLYRAVQIKNNYFIKKLLDKNFGFEYAYTGISFIKDYKRFKKIINISKKKSGEFQYFQDIFNEKKILFQKVKNWHDIGNEQNYIEACKLFEKKIYLKKYDESIFFHNQKVIKFFVDKNKVRERYERSKYLKNIVPDVINRGNYFYDYKFINGKILSETLINRNELCSLLNWCSKSLFKKIELSNLENSLFKKDCKKFYFNKTINRISIFRKKTKINDKIYLINNIKVPKFSQLIKKIHWQEIFQGYPAKFHGDFHFENIIKISKGYKLIDWREKFSKNYLYGDLYYDLAKLNHSFIVNHKKIVQKKFKINKIGNNVTIFIEKRLDLIITQKFFYKFLKKNNLNIYVVNILTSLIFLNISPLHHSPYREFLYFLGLDCLKKTIDNHEIIL
jgi:NDP-sugar pyrophosphorylase family protein